MPSQLSMSIGDRVFEVRKHPVDQIIAKTTGGRGGEAASIFLACPIVAVVLGSIIIGHTGRQYNQEAPFSAISTEFMVIVFVFSFCLVLGFISVLRGWKRFATAASIAVHENGVRMVATWSPNSRPSFQPNSKHLLWPAATPNPSDPIRRQRSRPLGSRAATHYRHS